ncbi:MAG: hypothetical protein RSB71_02070 [Bacilli bacterium]
MKKLGFICFLFLLLISNVSAKEKVDIHLFYSDLCSTCAEEEEFLNNYIKDKDYINIIKYEVTKDSSNAKLLNDVRTSLKNKELTTPYTVIGTMGITGFNDTVKKQMIAAIDKYHKEEYIDIVTIVKDKLDIPYEIDYPDQDFEVPILGKINPKTVSLPIIAIVVGFIDGFNPCAMWILLFLISMLFNMKNKRKMWILGLTFLVTSAFVYLAFMLAWLNVAITLSNIGFVRLIIALIAFIGGIINLSSYFKERKKDNGCEIIDDKKRKSMFTKIKKIIKSVDDDENKSFWSKEKGFIVALIGIMGLAIGVNLIELACSSGLPLVFTQILALNNLNGLQYFLYILLYIIFFLIDDIVIFILAMKTLKISGISTKYNKFSHLIGGIIMILIGLLMVLKPEWLMFKF